MDKAELVLCIKCKEKKEFYEFSKFGREDKRYKTCDNCRAKEYDRIMKDLTGNDRYVYPITINSWPFYGSGDKFKVIEPKWHKQEMRKMARR